MLGERAQSLQLNETHNRVQLSRLTAMAPYPQALFFQLLPLLLHGNFKLLPGYTNEDCPVGIADYQPTTDTLRAATSVDRNFQFRRKALRRYAVKGIYLLSNFNGLRYPAPARFTVWVVHQFHLSPEAIAALNQKLIAIQTWTAQMGITLNYQLVSETNLQQSPVIKQLADFYTNGLTLAGSLPLWWSITSKEQPAYANLAETLRMQVRSSETSILDFGAPLEVSAQQHLDDFVRYWFLAFHQGPQHDLDLLFAGQQCQLYPEVDNLSLLLKQRLEAGEKDNTALCTANLKLIALSRRQDDKSLLRARESLYRLSHERLSNKVLHPTQPWRQNFMQNLVSHWQWSTQFVRNIDQPLTQGIRILLNQPAERWRWLSAQLQQAQQFAHKLSLDTTQLKSASKYLALMLNPPADTTIDLALPGLPEGGLEQINLYRLENSTRWHLSDLAPSNAPQNALFSHDDLVSVMAFAIINRLLTRDSWLRISDPKPELASQHILDMSQQLLRSTVAQPIPPIEAEALQQPAVATQLILLTNLQPAPLDQLQQQGLQMTSNQSDPLSFSSAQTNLINSIDILLLSSWGQWHHLKYVGENAVVDVLTTILRWQPTKEAIQNLLCWCPSNFFGQSINLRLHDLIIDLTEFNQATIEQGQYLIQTAKQYWHIQWQDAQVEAQTQAAPLKNWQQQPAGDDTTLRVDPLLLKRLK